jgi:hypothetical protein
VPKEQFISFKFNVCQGLPFRKGRQALKRKKKNQSRLLKTGFFRKRKIKAGFSKQAFFCFFEEKEKENGRLGARPRRALGGDPPRPPLLSHPPNKHPHPPPLERKGRKENKKKPDACFVKINNCADTGEIPRATPRENRKSLTPAL